MYTGTVWGLTMIAVGLVVVLTSFQILVTAVFGRLVEHARQRTAARTGVSFWVGLAALAFGALVTAVAGRLGAVGPLLTVILGSLFILLALFGWAAASREIGERMTSSASAPWRATMRGAIVTGLVALVPGLGWFVVLPVCLAVGTGGIVLAALRGGVEARASGTQAA